ncbi:winged helix DNA-binding protein, partial [Candidatus Bathyarchaeota archaeon]|nr:winged helix DNA-binding protein [Candidatus Bathyarchaeota archaeon]
CMPNRRSRLDIMLNVLLAIKEGVDKPTRIMYATNLSWKPTQNILKNLVRQGLIRELSVEGEKRTKSRYALTEKGQDVIKYFEKAKDLLALDIL